MTSDFLSNLWCKPPWFWCFELICNDIPEVFFADIKQASAVTYLAPLMPTHDSEFDLVSDLAGRDRLLRVKLLLDGQVAL